MKLRKEFIIPLAVLVFALMGLEITGVKLGIGTATFHDTLSSKLTLNKGLNVNGVLSVNGSAITGGSVITASEEGSEIEDDMTGINFAGNLFTATTSSGAVTLTANLDTTKIATLNRSNTFTNTNTFNGQTYTGAIETGNTTVTGTLDVTTGVATFGNAINLIDNTKVITASGGDILYKVTTGGAHIMETISGLDLIKVDSTNGLSYTLPGGGWNSNPKVKVKLVKFATTSATLPAYINYAHGLASGGSKIIGVSGYVQCDTTGWNLSGLGAGNDLKFPPRCPLTAAGTYDMFFDSLNVTLYLSSGATAIRNNTDTAFFWLTYIE